MLDKNELLKLKEEHSTAKKSIGLFNKEQLDEIVELSEWLQNLITETEKMNKLSSTTDKNMHHMIKLHKKKEKLGKEKHIFEATVSNEMKKKALPIDIGKRMIDIIQLLKSNKIDSIGSKFNYFTELLKSKQVYYTNEETLTKERILIEREVDKSNKLLKDIDTLKSTTININKVNSHKEYLTELEKLEILRTKYIKFLLSF